MEIQLKRFDIKEIKDDKVVVLIGKRDTENLSYVKIFYHIIRVSQLDKLFLELKQQIVFMGVWFLNYLFMMNMSQVLLKDY